MALVCGASIEVWSGNFSRMGLHTSANSIASRITRSEIRIQRFRVMSTKLTKTRNNCIIKKIFDFWAYTKLPHAFPKWADTKVTSRMSKMERGGVKVTFGQCPKG